MKFRFMCCLITILLLSFSHAAQATRIKDIAGIKGVRQNQLIGYGLVVGLDGTGDDDKTEFTIQSLASMLSFTAGFVIYSSELSSAL